MTGSTILNKMTVGDVDVQGKRVLVRVDLNVPLEEGTNRISDDTRIWAVLRTIDYLITRGARVILCSHLGRPGGKPREELRLAPVAERLSELLGKRVEYVQESVGPVAERAVQSLGQGEVLLLENIRFYPEEEKNDPAFAQKLASLADIYVNDAFGTAHRAHASTEGVARFLPAVAGFLMEKEVTYFHQALENPRRPLAAIVGGAKVSDKIAMLENLLGRVDLLLIGGGMAATFFKAQGLSVGDSLLERERVAFAWEILRRGQERGNIVILPKDVLIGKEFSQDTPSQVVPVDKIPEGWRIMDIGPESIKLFRSRLATCKTVLWNGPMGICEFPKFASGTKAIADTLANLKAVTIVGGGSTAEVVESLGLSSRMSHVSTGGGASLEMLEGKTLPGVAALKDAT